MLETSAATLLEANKKNTAEEERSYQYIALHESIPLELLPFLLRKYLSFSEILYVSISS